MHPKRRDKVRTFLAKKSLFQLFILFVFIYLVVSAIISLALFSNNYYSGQFGTRSFSSIFYDVLLIMVGFDATHQAFNDYLQDSKYIWISLGFIGIVMPGLFFGAIVFKYFIPKNNILIWENSIHLVQINGRDVITPLFYIASDLKLYQLEFDVVLRIYESRHEDGSSGRYPLKGVRLQASSAELQLPYPYVPTTFHIPVIIGSSGQEAVEGQLAGLLLRYNDNAELCRIEYHDADALDEPLVAELENEDWAELHIISRGVMPEVGMNLVEVASFDLEKQLRREDLDRPKTQYDKEKRKFMIDKSEWKRFNRRNNI